MALLVYVDDIVLASNNARASQAFKTYLDTCFSIKDLGSLKYFLGIDECGLLGAKPVNFPIEGNHTLAAAIGRLLNDAT